jgi:hypothetical protein
MGVCGKSQIQSAANQRYFFNSPKNNDRINLHAATAANYIAAIAPELNAEGILHFLSPKTKSERVTERSYVIQFRKKVRQ